MGEVDTYLLRTHSRYSDLYTIPELELGQAQMQP